MQVAIVGFVAIVTIMHGREIATTLRLFKSSKSTGSSIRMHAGVAREMHVRYSFNVASLITIGKDEMMFISIPIFGLTVSTVGRFEDASGLSTAKHESSFSDINRQAG